jgi:hypothetical protein
MEIEPVTPAPPLPMERVVFTQTWSQLAFLHWAVEPDVVAPQLPPGVRPDVIDGVTYVGLIPFVMRGIGLYGSPGVPWLGSFLETNVRLYSVDATGRRGVVFATLDASRLIPVLAARWGPGLPYVWSRMRRYRAGDRLVYTCRRRWPGPRDAASRVVVSVGDPIDGGPLAHFLTARWGLHQTDRRGRTVFWPNAHDRWPLRTATLEHLDDDLLAAAGFPDLAARPPDSVLFSEGVDVVFGPRRPVPQS